MRCFEIGTIAVVLSLLPSPTFAGAWTLDRGRIQQISGVTSSHASRGFDHSGKPKQKVQFNKLFVQNYFEYGLTDAVTLFVAPEFVTAQSNMSGGSGIARSQNTAVEGGVRILLLSHIGMLSIQSSVKTAGAFDMSVSANNAAGRQVELRLLYGKSFTVLGADGYADLQVSERWIHRPRPNEMTIDATAGVKLNRSTLLMVRMFNTISGGGGQPPYTFYRTHKLELSFVRQITNAWSFQLGAFLSPVGQNTIVEQGIGAAVWYRV